MDGDVIVSVRSRINFTNNEPKNRMGQAVLPPLRRCKRDAVVNTAIPLLRLAMTPSLPVCGNQDERMGGIDHGYIGMRKGFFIRGRLGEACRPDTAV